jgi:hypothetical protein
MLDNDERLVDVVGLYVFNATSFHTDVALKAAYGENAPHLPGQDER